MNFVTIKKFLKQFFTTTSK